MASNVEPTEACPLLPADAPARLITQVHHPTDLDEDNPSSVIDQDNITSLQRVESGLRAASQGLIGHKSIVRALAALPDGRLVSGGADRSIRFWNTVSKECERVLVGHGGPVTSLASSSDGQLASGSSDGNVRIWKLSDYSCIYSIDAHDSTVAAVVWLTDEVLATACWSGTIKTWDLSSGAVKLTLAGHTGRITGLVKLEDGRLMSASWDGTLRVWNTSKVAWGSRETMRIEAHTGPINALIALVDDRVASGGDDGKLKIWDIGRKTLDPVSVSTFPGSVVALTAMQTGKLLSATLHTSSAGSELTTPLTGTGSSQNWILCTLAEGRVAVTGADRVIHVHDPSKLMLEPRATHPSIQFAMEADPA